MPVAPVPVDRAVSETLAAFRAGRATTVPGTLTRLAHALVPSSLSRRLMMRMFSSAVRASGPSSEGDPGR